MQTVIGAFDDEAQAQRAVDQLASDGFDRSDVHVERGQDGTGQVATGTSEEHRHHGFLAWLFGESDEHQRDRSVYTEAVRRGSSLVVVDAQDDAQAARAVSCLQGLGAINVNERAQQWRTEGWSDGQPLAGAERDDTPADAKEGVLDVVQEELQVGKRQLDNGGVRVIQRVSEQPVREVLRLRQERAVVDRRAVDRPATAGDLDTFKEGTLEVRETAEEPVIAKTARVVEEVRVGKKVEEREQVVEDTVRRKDVDVQQLQGNRTMERDRAVAADSPRLDSEPARDMDRAVARDREDVRPGDLGDKPRRNL